MLLGDGPAGDSWRIISLILGVALVIAIVLLLMLRAKRERVGTALRREEEMRKRVEEELRKSEENFSKVLQLAPMAVSLMDATTCRYLDVNEKFEQLSGYRREEVLGHCVEETSIWGDFSEPQFLAEKLGANGGVRDIEFEYVTKSGEHRKAQGSADLIEVEGAACVVRMAADITDAKRTMRALEESEKKFGLMMDSAPMLVWISGPDKLRTVINKEWLKFTGRSVKQDLGDGWTENVHHQDLPARLERFDQAFEARQPFEGQFRLRRNDGTYRWMLERAMPCLLDDGGLAGYVGCLIDITNEQEVKQLRAELGGQLIRAQEEERTRVARELHDDINQRLALLANGLVKLKGSTAESDQNSIPKDVHALWHLTNEIAADVQHLSHQLHPSKLHYLGLGSAVRDLCQEFTRQYKMEIECVVRDLPRDLDEGTSLSLFRTAQESLHNAAKHSRAAHVRVELSREDASIRLRVSDDGVGFEAMEGRHSGLGLISMRERVLLVGGNFSVWSRPSLGTQIEAIVPRASRQGVSQREH